MASKLKVDELRSQLSQRGLNTSGTKPILVQRLKLAISNEKNIDNKSSSNDQPSTASIGRKRKRESEEDVSVKVDDVVKLRLMGLLQLRKQATLRGVSTTGLKKQLLERLCADIQNRHEEAPKEVNGSAKATGENVPDKVDDVQKLHAMRIRQLREKMATLHGVRTIGSKNELASLREIPRYSNSYFKNHYQVPNNQPFSIQLQETQLESRIAKFISLICNTGMMWQQTMEIGYNAEKLSKSTILKDDLLYSQYKSLQCKLVPLGVESQERAMIEMYMRNTNVQTHSNYNNVDIVQIFRVSRHGESERFKKFSCAENRMLLWHGSRLTNWTGILSQGLRISKARQACTYRRGIYFADMFAKSANYCYPFQASTAGVLLLCEVALGEMEEGLFPNSNTGQLPKGKRSKKVVGSIAPDSSEFKVLEDGVVVPLGKPKKEINNYFNVIHSLPQYNEYIVYNEYQIRMRYIIHVNFDCNFNFNFMR
ncbi:hypothetical protein AQUCO_00300705v1 [Aquilegia coerulea]|uniref:Poly [ADP-ribose] polymerase n=1 Tax=Aquilegia coerulea TaxID=218851 RepID=A0A2G5F036_AQUCA|nr:hypothetical protein AQUCO_00300705v1 [Aquilegia coerulea]